ncbi:hypothetical protein HD806DRAFT_552238 [Xylariaceae sp. AK1471]|nr:hypothetical protein HD806DRAFT_552238 [Xylariaceae sp. AK1471]
MFFNPLQVTGPLLLGLVTVASSEPSATSAEIQPRANSINITSVTGSGTGCPEGAFTTNLSPDGTVISIGFDAFEVYIGPGTVITDRSKTCILRVTADYSSAHTFGAQGTTWHGYEFMSDKMTGSFISTYMFAGNTTTNISPSTTAKASITSGQLSEVYTVHTAPQESGVIWAPCSRDPGRVTLQVTSRIALTTQDTKPSGTINDEPPLSLVAQQIHLGWKSC